MFYSKCLSVLLLSMYLGVGYADNPANANPANLNSQAAPVAQPVLVATPVSQIYTDANKPIVVKADNPEFTIKLQSNPTTGYSWYLVQFNQCAIKPVKYAFERPDNNLVGAPGYEIWQFKLRDDAFSVPQTFNIKFTYMRAWEGKPAQDLTFTVVTTASNSNQGM